MKNFTAYTAFCIWISLSQFGNSEVFVVISGSFNRDTIAVSSAELPGTGYRFDGDVFINEGFTGVTPPFGGTNLPDPSGDGFGIISAGNHDFLVGPYDGLDEVQLNTFIVEFGTVETIDISNMPMQSLSVLFSAVGYNPDDSENGTLTVTYTDSTSQDFVWDVADSLDQGGLQGLAAVAIDGMDLFRANTGTFIAGNNRRWLFQDFDELDSTRVVDNITFAATGFGDALGDGAEFGIYAITATNVLVGDVNCDGSVDLLDVAPFVDLISSGIFEPKADINQDGNVDLLDVGPFVDLLSGG